MKLPGDRPLSDQVKRMIRVNQAGEYGAKRIYEGQLAVLKGTESEATIEHMKEQELVHLDYFDKASVERDVRPTALQPFWHVAGFALGAGTALLGEKAAMACTIAVEEVIDEHYAEQVETLKAEKAEPELVKAIEKFREEELEHRDTGIEHGGEEATAYPVLSGAIKAGSRAAIWLATRF